MYITHIDMYIYTCIYIYIYIYIYIFICLCVCICTSRPGLHPNPGKAVLLLVSGNATTTQSGHTSKPDCPLESPVRNLHLTFKPLPGSSAHEKSPPPLGPPESPRRRPTVGS